MRVNLEDEAEVESDPAKLVSDNAGDIDNEYQSRNQMWETKKPLFSFFDVIIFWINGKIEQNI